MKMVMPYVMRSLVGDLYALGCPAGLPMNMEVRGRISNNDETSNHRFDAHWPGVHARGQLSTNLSLGHYGRGVWLEMVCLSLTDGGSKTTLNGSADIIRLQKRVSSMRACVRVEVYCNESAFNAAPLHERYRCACGGTQLVRHGGVALSHTSWSHQAYAVDGCEPWCDKSRVGLGVGR